MFEGIALGSRIASIGKKSALATHHAHGDSSTSSSEKGGLPTAGIHSCGPAVNAAEIIDTPLSLRDKLLMVIAFSLVTPIGMAIGIGVLKSFNGNDPSTLIALGTLNALSAGILLWVGIGKLHTFFIMHLNEG